MWALGCIIIIRIEISIQFSETMKINGESYLPSLRTTEFPVKTPEKLNQLNSSEFRTLPGNTLSLTEKRGGSEL